MFCFIVTVQESVLFNTRRSVQKVKVYGSPSWCFNSFIQPVHKVTAEHDLIEMMNKMRTRGGSKCFGYSSLKYSRYCSESILFQISKETIQHHLIAHFAHFN